MKYVNAKDVLPPHLLRQVQKYTAGQLIYVPSRERKRRWGEISGGQQSLRERNRCIRQAHAAGTPVEVLADSWHLSPERIRHIVYDRKETGRMELQYCATLTSAREWAQHGRLEDWIHAYLLAEGHNKPFSDGLKIVDRIFLGPVTMPVALFTRCCGPEEGMTYRIPAEGWAHRVTQLMQAIGAGADLPPLIVHYLIPEGEREGVFELNDGNHRHEACRRLGIAQAPVIVWITDRDEYEQFMARFGSLFDNAE